MLRFTEQIPEDLDKGVWSQRLGHKLKLWLQSAEESIGGLQGTPDTPSEVQAGATADAGVSQAPAPSDHTHSLSTAAPSVPIALAGPATEGSATSTMRSDAGNYLGQNGAADDQILTWDAATSSWIAENRSILPWILC